MFLLLDFLFLGSAVCESRDGDVDEEEYEDEDAEDLVAAVVMFALRIKLVSLRPWSAFGWKGTKHTLMNCGETRNPSARPAMNRMTDTVVMKMRTPIHFIHIRRMNSRGMMSANTTHMVAA